jgi:hypothetical protein
MRGQGLGPVQVVFASPVVDQVYTFSLNFRFTNVKRINEIEATWNAGMAEIGPSLDNAMRTYSNHVAELAANMNSDPSVASAVRQNLQSRLGNPTISGVRSARIKQDDGSGKLHSIFEAMLFSFSVKLPFAVNRT